MTLRYVPEALGGEGSIPVTWEKPRSAERKLCLDLVLGVRVQQWWPTIRSRQDQVRTKNRKTETLTTVRSRTAVVHNIRDKAYPTVKASIA